MPRRKPKPKRITEAQRHTVQLKLRVQEPVSDELRARATSSGMTISAVVSALVMATTEER